VAARIVNFESAVDELKAHAWSISVFIIQKIPIVADFDLQPFAADLSCYL
jgi:hypothetical protein